MEGREAYKRKRQLAIDEVLNSNKSEIEKIDAISIERNWFRGTDGNILYETVKSYMDGSLDLESTVKTITEPIDESFSTADKGQAILQGELTATYQRTFLSAEQAKEAWGESLPESELPAPLDENEYNSTEGQLWELWYSVLHTAKKTPWRDTAAQEKLVNLVRALITHSDPPLPSKMTMALKNDWIWSLGTLWSRSAMLGPSARESWNDSPGCGSGYSLPEIHAWTNVNAFVAHLTGTKTAEFWDYAIWAMRDALEIKHNPEYGHVPAPVVTQLDGSVPAAAVWAIILGKSLWEREQDLTPTDPNQGDSERGGEGWEGTSQLSKKRYAFWAKRLNLMSKDGRLMAETRRIAGEAYRTMDEIMKREL